ncbi:Endoribonuclease L-PSP/chorismate mutase-like protein [Emericellopsis atlantica]|uniref:Endoribonuclease L-PSP/chorismate mutase-like protein n=1 Tax=Emericellopsis atlantica TaxID=2614577 RepID=A0A9P7ZTZ8_9HYPO|nr:Endoribonuclease L-PSP/chorismate mutase-like protein [Emericellopsis atlantica]KAG9258235.1 Endoribonuclease L-PSP/chorismate mutase-like protein [Emericellopsis atlantica]
MSRTTISTPNAPPPLPQFVQAVSYNGLLFCSGAVGIDPSTKTMVEGTVQDRARQCLRNLTAVLEAGGSGLDKVLKVNIYLTDMANFAAFNAVWDEFFTTDQKPARTCVAVHQLPLGTDVEVECTAIAGQGARL